MENNSTSQRSPLSPTNWPTDAFVWTASLLTFGAVALAFVAGLIVATGILLYSTHGDTKSALRSVPLFTLALAQLVSYLPIVGTIGRVLPWLAKRSLVQLGLAVPTLRDVGVAAGGAVLMFVAVDVVATLQASFTHVELKQDAVAMLDRSPLDAGYYLMLAIGALFAPFVEELVFRGFLFNAFLRYVPFATAALASGALFGAAHVYANGGGGPLYTAFFPLFAGGLVLAWVYHTTGKLTASMLTHAFFNSATLLAVTLAHFAPHAHAVK